MSTQNSKLLEQKLEAGTIEGLNPHGFFNESSTKGSCSVKVAVRVRPLLNREISTGESSCIRSNVHNNTVVVGLERTFGFDKVFSEESTQEEVFDICIKNLLLSSFAGYNSTVLAYGQTCSGKTFTMGTEAALTGLKDQQGIIPRVVRTMFDEIEKRKGMKEFVIRVSFIEIYNEEINDLLDPQGQSKITIRELTRGIPSLCGQREERVSDCESLFKLLEKGAVHRRTRSTLMNESSSRSHAILEVNIEQHLIEDLYQGTDSGLKNTSSNEQEFITAKFHFVDLAGSERIKKTGADGESLQEGISINKALFVLGKVINSLIEDGGKNTYKPYRESSLTRILQDSLGGNSRTTMIACVSPAESNQEETLSTLLYACKARSIKNKPIVNRDPNTTRICQLQQQVNDLQRELARYKKTGIPPLPSHKETLIEIPETKDLKAELASVKRENERLKEVIGQLEGEERKRQIEFLEIQKERDILKLHNEKLKNALQDKRNEVENLEVNEEELSTMEQYKNEIMKLKEQNTKKANELKELQMKYEEECKNSNIQNEQMLNLNKELQKVKRILTNLRKEEKKIMKSQTVTTNSYKESFQPTNWLSTDFDEQLREANNNFINELAQSLGTLITDTTKQSSEDNQTKGAITPMNKLAEEEATQSFSDYTGEVPRIAMEEAENVMKNSPRTVSVPDSTKQSPVEFKVEEFEEYEEVKKKDTEMEKTLDKVEGDIHEREKMLSQIKEKHKEMQKNLIAIMENQYHKKLEELEKEMDKLKNDQENAVQLAPKDERIGQQYKKMITEYENKIKEYRKHEANQKKLLKQTKEQEEKIQTLTDEIMKMRQQKNELVKQIKGERTNYEKHRKEQIKQSMKLKQETIKQKIIIAKLTHERDRGSKARENIKIESARGPLNLTKEQLMNYKILVEDFATRLVNMKQETTQVMKEQQRQGEINTKLNVEYDVLYKLKLESEKLSLLKTEYDPSKDYDKIKEIEETLDKQQKLIKEHQMIIDNLEETLKYHEQKTAKLLQTKAIIRGQLSTLLGKGKIKSSKELNELITALFEILADEKIKRSNEMAKLKAEQNTITALNSNIQDLMRANKILREEFEIEVERLKATYAAKEAAFKAEHDTLMNEYANIEQMNILCDCNKGDKAKTEPDDKNDAKFLKKELDAYKKRNTDIMKENSLLRGQIIGLTGANEQLSKNSITLSRKMDDLACKLKKSDPRNAKSSAALSTPKLANLNEKRLNKKRRQLNESSQLKNCTMTAINQINGDCNIKAVINELAAKIEQRSNSTVKMPNSSRSSVCDSKAQVETSISSKQFRVERTKSFKVSKNENEGLMKTLKERSNLVSLTSKVKSNIIKESINQNNTQTLAESNKWKCVYNEEQHSFGIFSLAAFEHYLISSSNVLKLWDINKRQVLNEIPVTNPRVLYVSNKLLISASEKQGAVVFYDLPNLEVVQTVETGLDAVRAIHVDDYYLFLGGSGNAGALQLWDLKTMTRIYEKEKGQDIFSILRKDAVVYYGGRNRCINRVNFDTMVSL